ncbi:MAG: hypothetical protein KDK39_13435 [Leptospiraceae bacterium]|nr:hypothetical protein [Leptospiraceae bacterium]
MSPASDKFAAAENLVRIFQAQLHDVAGLTSEYQHVASQAIPIGADIWCVVLRLRGNCNGFAALSLPARLSDQIALSMIERALEAEFNAAQLTTDLSRNTVGELLNMSLGAYFASHNQGRATFIQSPFYSNTLAEQALFDDMAWHFRLDVSGGSLFLSCHMGFNPVEGD